MLGQRKRPRLGGARASHTGCAYLTYAGQQPASAQFVPVTGGAGLIGPAPFFVLAQPSHSQAETAISPNPVVASTNKHHSTKSIAATPSARRTDNRALQWRFLTGRAGRHVHPSWLVRFGVLKICSTRRRKQTTRPEAGGTFFGPRRPKRYWLSGGQSPHRLTPTPRHA